MTLRVRVLAAAVAAVSTLTACDSTTSRPSPAATVTGEVVAVVDGDTLDVDLAGERTRVRLLGINAPEIGRDGDASECYADESRELLNELAYGERVALVADGSQDNEDTYGRILRYVELDGTDLGGELVAAGAAAEYTYDRPYDRRDTYRATQDAADAAGAGMWGACGQ